MEEVGLYEEGVCFDEDEPFRVGFLCVCFLDGGEGFPFVEVSAEIWPVVAGMRKG